MHKQCISTSCMQLFLLFGAFIQNNAEAKQLRHFGICSWGNEPRKYCVAATECNTIVSEYVRIDRNSGNALNCTHPTRQDLVCCSRENIRDATEAASTAPVLVSRFSGNTVQLLEPPDCGNSLAFRIYQGNVTGLNEFPWTATLIYSSGSGNEDILCGASLIDKRWVITAAHCVLQKFTGTARVKAVRLGEWNMDTNPDCIVDITGKEVCAPPHEEIEIDQVIAHTEFDKPPYNYSNDIALLKLSRDVEFSNYIKPICLPLQDDLRNSQLVDNTLDISGWGRTEHNNMRSSIKLKAEITVWPLQECLFKYTEHNINLDNRQLCGVGQNGADSCSGDSGGPVMLNAIGKRKRRYFFLAGIVSYGHHNCGSSDFPAVYSRVGAYIDWIRNTIEAYS